MSMNLKLISLKTTYIVLYPAVKTAPLYTFIRFDTIPACDVQTDRNDVAKTALIIAACCTSNSSGDEMPERGIALFFYHSCI